MRPGRVPRDLASTTISEAEFAWIPPFCKSKRPRAKFSRNTSLAPSAKRMARTRQVSAIDIFSVGSGLTVDIPLYEGGLLCAQVQTARAAVATARWELEAEQERVETGARAQWGMIASPALVVQDFEQAVEEARTAATLIRDKLAAGQATVVDEVDARHVVLRAAHDVLDGHLRLAGTRIDLLRLLAALDPNG